MPACCGRWEPPRPPVAMGQKGTLCAGSSFLRKPPSKKGTKGMTGSSTSVHGQSNSSSVSSLKLIKPCQQGILESSCRLSIAGGFPLIPMSSHPKERTLHKGKVPYRSADISTLKGKAAWYHSGTQPLIPTTSKPIRPPKSKRSEPHFSACAKGHAMAPV